MPKSGNNPTLKYGRTFNPMTLLKCLMRDLMAELVTLCPGMPWAHVSTFFAGMEPKTLPFKSVLILDKSSYGHLNWLCISGLVQASTVLSMNLFILLDRFRHILFFAKTCMFACGIPCRIVFDIQPLKSKVPPSAAPKVRPPPLGARCKAHRICESGPCAPT